MTGIDELIERCKAATGPDREIDLDLFRIDLGKSAFAPDYWTSEQIEELTPRYTASVDAALALVERLAGGEGTKAMVYNFDLGWHASAHAEMAYTAELFVADGEPCEMLSYQAQAHTLPLAILIALLQALGASNGQ